MIPRMGDTAGGGVVIRQGMLLAGPTAIPLSQVSSVDQTWTPVAEQLVLLKITLMLVALILVLVGFGGIANGGRWDLSRVLAGLGVMVMGGALGFGAVWLHRNSAARPAVYSVVLTLNSGDQRAIDFGTAQEADAAARTITAAIAAERQA